MQNSTKEKPMSQQNLTLLNKYAMYFALIFWLIKLVTTLLGLPNGVTGGIVIGVSMLITHLLFKQTNRLLTNDEQLKLAIKCTSNVFWNAWLPLLILWFFHFEERTKELLLHTFHKEVLPTAILAVTVVFVFGFLANWGAIKGYTYLLKKDIEKS